MTVARAAAILLRKELRLEFRTRELLAATIVFGLIVVVLFSFALNPTPDETRRYGPGLLWIAFLFAGSLMLNPSFAREHENETLDALRMAPISSFAVLLGKMAANFIFLAIAEVVLVPAFAVLYNVSLGEVAGRLIAILALGTAGIAIVGTVFSAISAHARMRELLLPLLLLPVLVPLLIAAVEATGDLLAPATVSIGGWLEVLGAFDVVFLTASWLLSDFLTEE